MQTNFVEVVTEAIKAVGTSDADWRVQAGAAVLLIASGIGVIKSEKIRRHIKGWKTKRKGNK